MLADHIEKDTEKLITQVGGQEDSRDQPAVGTVIGGQQNGSQSDPSQEEVEDETESDINEEEEEHCCERLRKVQQDQFNVVFFAVLPILYN